MGLLPPRRPRCSLESRIPPLIVASTNTVRREPRFEQSTIVNDDHTPYSLNTSHRSSFTAFFPPTEPDLFPDHRVIKCVEDRASAFQGHVPIETMEHLQFVRYIYHLQTPVTDYQDTISLSSIKSTTTTFP